MRKFDVPLTGRRGLIFGALFAPKLGFPSWSVVFQVFANEFLVNKNQMIIKFKKKKKSIVKRN